MGRTCVPDVRAADRTRRPESGLRDLNRLELANAVDRRGVRGAVSEQQNSGQEQGQTPENTGQAGGREPTLKLLIGRICCVLGILVGVGGIVAALLGAAASISTGALGIGLGVLGYFLGARRLAVATVVLGVAALVLVAAGLAGHPRT